MGSTHSRSIKGFRADFRGFVSIKKLSTHIDKRQIQLLINASLFATQTSFPALDFEYSARCVIKSNALWIQFAFASIKQASEASSPLPAFVHKSKAILHVYWCIARRNPADNEEELIKKKTSNGNTRKKSRSLEAILWIWESINFFAASLLMHFLPMPSLCASMNNCLSRSCWNGIHRAIVKTQSYWLKKQTFGLGSG